MDAKYVIEDIDEKVSDIIDGAIHLLRIGTYEKKLDVIRRLCHLVQVLDLHNHRDQMEEDDDDETIE